MDLSYEGENNFALPEPDGKLDFTEDVDQTKNVEQAESMNVSMTEEEMTNNNNEQSESDDEQIEEQFVEEPFNKPIINQNLMLNRNNVQKKTATTKTVYNSNGLQEPVTPALIKRKQFKAWFNSPTDNCLSPCTQKLFKNKKPI